MIRVAILDDHQGIIDGYRYRLESERDIKITATMTYGEELSDLLKDIPVDVLLLDLQVPTSPNNPQPFPIFTAIPQLLKQNPDLAILAISMHAQRALILSVMEAGGRGFIVKDDQTAIQELAAVIRSVHVGGTYLSAAARQKITGARPGGSNQLFSPRQIEVLSVCAAYPDENITDLAARLSIAPSTLRNLLTRIYMKLGVHNRFAAVERARQLNLILPGIRNSPSGPVAPGPEQTG